MPLAALIGLAAFGVLALVCAALAAAAASGTGDWAHALSGAMPGDWSRRRPRE